ncbi:hypothetical protein ABT126_35685 [Streptomyces sp. NPDC002012]
MVQLVFGRVEVQSLSAFACGPVRTPQKLSWLQAYCYPPPQ